MNAVGAQKGWNTWHQSKGVNRPVKVFTCTEDDIKRIYEEQGGRSRWLGIPINPEDVFRKHYPLSPSLDRLDNSPPTISLLVYYYWCFSELLLSQTLVMG